MLVSLLRHGTVERAKIVPQLQSRGGADDGGRDELAAVNPRQSQLSRSQPDLRCYCFVLFFRHVPEMEAEPDGGGRGGTVFHTVVKPRILLLG